LGVEGAARKARYQALEQSTADWILLAHHADDQAETVLLNLFRGAGVRGLGGMLPANGRFLRPLLGLRRSELKQYADNHGLSWIEDESNSDTRYTRNFIRQDLLPNISKRYPAISRQLAGTAERIAEADGLLAQLALIDSKCDTLKFPVPLKILRALEPARSMNLLRYTLLEYKLQTPGQCRMREFIRQLRTASPDKHPELKIGKWVLRSQRQQLHLIEIPVTLDGE
jgi:tRNA(Ile)-lysidine synthase